MIGVLKQFVRITNVSGASVQGQGRVEATKRRYF